MIKGCFVPANKIRLGLMDKLFVKIHTGLCRKILTFLKKNYLCRYSSYNGSIKLFT